MLLNPQELNLYLSKLVGQPWERKGLHCWRVVVKVQLDLYGRAVPLAAANMVNREKLIKLMGQDCREYGWREIHAPVDGAVVRMHRKGGNPADLEHAGVFLAIGQGYVLHSDDPHGVVLDTLTQLDQVRGWVPRYFVPNE